MNLDIHQHRLLILDFGSQYAQLIARRVREIGVYCELLPCDINEKVIQDFSPHGIILSGGPETVTLHHTPRVPDMVFRLGCPVLGICYGMQAMALQLGGEVNSGSCEFGYAQVRVSHPGRLLANIEDHIAPDGRALLDVWMSHGDHVNALPPGFIAMAATPSSPYAIIGDTTRHLYGLQFHPEVTHTPQGRNILERFVIEICRCIPSWTSQHIIEDRIQKIREQVGKDSVLLGLSGGVDSAVAAALIHRAIGDQLTCLFVDTGLLRHNEGEEVMQIFAQHLGMRVQRVNAEARFFSALRDVIDPEKKRKIIGAEFIRVFEEQGRQLKDIRWLGQGTIYPDVIESARTQSGKSHVIKSHHNVGGLPEVMHLNLLEPLVELFKDEVRQLGLKLGLPADLIYRHPFPGPGLAVRILGEIRKEFVHILQMADAIYIEELKQQQLYHQVSQAFAVFLPVKSVGVKGDARSYDYTIALRAVETSDFMTAHWAKLPYEFLAHVSHRIINEVPHVARVVYDISGKPPATIEWE